MHEHVGIGSVIKVPQYLNKEWIMAMSGITIIINDKETFFIENKSKVRRVYYLTV